MRAGLAVAALLLVAAVAAAAADEFGQLQLVPMQRQEPAFLSLSWSATKPPSAGAMPTFEGSPVWFSALKLGDNQPMLMAVDPGKPSVERGGQPKQVVVLGPAPNAAIYLDLDGDQSLDDEQPLRMAQEAEGGWPPSMTPPITVKVSYQPTEGDQVVQRDYKFRLAIPWLEANQAPMVISVADEAWEGKVLVGGRVRLARLVDGDGDALIAAGGAQDRLWLDTNGDGKLSDDEQLPLSKYVLCADRYYEVQAGRDGSRLSLPAYEGPLGKLCLWAKDGKGAPTAVTQVYAMGASAYVQRAEKTASLDLPPGEYSVYYYLPRRDGKQGLYSFQPPRSVTIVGGKTRDMRCGLPLELGVQTSTQAVDARGATILVNITARAAQTGHAFAPQPAPSDVAKVQVINKAGRVVATAKAGYG